MLSNWVSAFRPWEVDGSDPRHRRGTVSECVCVCLCVAQVLAEKADTGGTVLFSLLELGSFCLSLLKLLLRLKLKLLLFETPPAAI